MELERAGRKGVANVTVILVYFSLGFKLELGF